MSKLHHIVTHGSGDHYGYEFWCLGCKNIHSIPTAPHPKGWTFNGSEDAPTFGPSILVHEVKREDGTVYSPRCHSFVVDGRIRYLGDCGHELAGQTVDLPEWKGYREEDYQ